MATIQLEKKPPRPRKPPRRDLKKLVSTRRGSALVAAVSAMLAAGLLLVFLHQYRASLHLGEQPVTVLVARNLIEKGSSGTIIAERSIFQTAQVRKRDLKNGAIADPGNLRGKVAVNDIYPGQQLVMSDFAPATGGVRDQLIGTDRAISLPLDNAHGMIGDIQAGDHVDVFYDMGSTGPGATQNRTLLVMLMRNLLVLRAPVSAKATGVVGGSNTQEVVLRASDTQAAQLAFASDNGRIWIVLRPKVGAGNSKPGMVDTRALVLASAVAAVPAGSGR